MNFLKKFAQKFSVAPRHDSYASKTNMHNLPTNFDAEKLKFWKEKLMLSDLGIWDFFHQAENQLINSTDSLPLWETVAEQAIIIKKQLAYQERNWLSYARTMDYLEMLLMETGRNDDALDWGLKAAYLWANRPDDGRAYFNPAPQNTVLPAGDGNRIGQLSLKLRLSGSEVKEKFLSHAKLLQTQVNAPLTPEEAWLPVSGTIRWY